jgi:hypothetical protein
VRALEAEDEVGVAEVARPETGRHVIREVDAERPRARDGLRQRRRSRRPCGGERPHLDRQPRRVAPHDRRGERTAKAVRCADDREDERPLGHAAS